MRRSLAATSLLGPALALALTALGCESEAPRSTFPVTFTARADEPLPGVEISIEGNKRLGVTGPDGVLRVTLAGREGTTVPFRVTCPDGYRAPREMPVLALRRFTGLDPATAARGIEVSIECPPAERMAALVLTAGQPDLPVLAQGREVARTNAGGVAHALVSLPPNSTFRVVVDTSRDPRLRPQNPATTLTVADSDEIFLIDQAFEVDEPPRPVVKRKPPKKKKPKPKPKPRVIPKKTGPEKLK